MSFEGSPKSSSKFGIYQWVLLLCCFYLLSKATRGFLAEDFGWKTWFAIIGGGCCLIGFLSELADRRKKVPAPGGERLRAEHPREAEPDEDAPIRSLVLLLDQPRNIKDSLWVEHVGKALGVHLSSDADDSLNFVIPLPHPLLKGEGDTCFMLKVPQGMFWILNLTHPYFDDVKAWASQVKDRRLREAVEDHKAWISVDAWDGNANKEETYDVLGKVIAALAGPDVRAIVAPEINGVNEFDPILLPRLSGGNPLEIFEHPTFAPVINASNGEQMEAAIAEARNRWPEFSRIFQSRIVEEGKPFIVKAPFTEGEETEHMWLTVDAIEGDMITGTLANQPHRLLDYHEGQQVTVKATELTDWLCVGPDGGPLGGWTNKVLNGEG